MEFYYKFKYEFKFIIKQTLLHHRQKTCIIFGSGHLLSDFIAQYLKIQLKGQIYIYIMVRAMKLQQTLLLTLMVLALTWQVSSQTSCHALCNCPNSTCLSCYENFAANSASSTAINGSCPCPQGFFSYNSMCMFCPDNCKVCNSSSNCIQCFSGYTFTNGSCINIKYPNGETWIAYETNQDFKYDANGSPSLFGFTLISSDNSITTTNLNCSTISNSPIVAFKLTGTANLSLIRTFYGLPHHEWAHLSLRYFALDSWSGQNISFQFYLDKKIANVSYNNSLRTKNLCASSTPDSVDQIHSYIYHNKSSLAINITVPANVSVGLLSIKLDVGTCPRNCKLCLNPKSCLTCEDHYYNDGGICKCNTTLGHVVNYGCLKNCQPGYVYIQGIERCTLCSIYIRDCYICQNYSICQKCNQHTFLYNNETCVIKCPPSFFEKKVAWTGPEVNHCHACSANCSQCFNQTLCITCINGNYLNEGICVNTCPSGTSIIGSRCLTSNSCPTGCASCNLTVCTACFFGYWLSGTSCLLDCTPTMYKYTNRTCLSCAPLCARCVDSDTCVQCQFGYSLRNGSCQVYSSNCNDKPGYYFDARVSNCIACPLGCVTCFKSLCYTCATGYYLDNGLCKTECTLQKYFIQDNITTNNLCYWRHLMCQSTNSTQLCVKCRPLDYPLSLGSDSKCRSSCQANKTFSARSNILTESQRQCTASCPSNCQICIQTSVCVKCGAGYVLSALASGTCVSVCQSGYVSDSLQCNKCPDYCSSCDLTGNCLTWTQSKTNVSCPTNCYYCISTKCVICKPNFYLNSNGACSDSCPLSTFQDSVSLHCRKCAPQCQTCISFSRCTSCINGFYFYGQSCVRDCQNGLYPNAETRVCQPCASNCRTCFGPREHQCVSCYLNSVKDHSQCLTECPVHKYVDSWGNCDWCHQACKYCFGPADFQCLECDNSYYLYRGQCYPQCPAATYLAIIPTRQCKQCSWGCSRCLSSSQCYECFSGFYLNNKQCYDVCPIGTYYSWTTRSCAPCPFLNCTACVQSACYQCAPNYSLFNGTCVQGCPNGTFRLDYYYGLECRTCAPQCLNCTSQYECTSCITGLVLKNGQCTKNCDPSKYYDLTSASCKSCSVGCLACTAWGCSQCQIGYFKYNGACVQSCPASTYYILQSIQCAVCPSTCTVCSSYYQCTQCKAGYTLVNGVCTNQQNCSTNCQQCGDPNNCIICKAGYFRFTNSSGKFCINVCPSGTYYNLDTECLPCSSECLQCYNPNQCIQCRSGLILFMGKCIPDCYPGFYSKTVNNTKRCQQCSAECQQCANTSVNCTVCSSPTAFILNNTCVQKKQCQLSAFYSDMVGYCLPCVQYCKKCSNPVKCDECLPNYYISVQGLCRSSCPQGTYIDLNSQNMYQCTPCPFPCKICTASNMCSQCYNGYPLNTTSSECQINCIRQVGYFVNAQTNKCQKCDTKCLQCEQNSLRCIKCAEGFYLIGNQCVIQCPQGTFPATDVRQCLPCSQYCQICTSQTNCQQCQPLTFILDGHCLPVCPTGYFNQSGFCQKCIQPCQECSGGSTYECISCVEGTFLFNNRCIKNCPGGYFKNFQTKSCRQCPSKCLTCTDFSNCQSCATGYTLNSISKQCETVPNCPSSLPNCENCVTNITSNTVQCSYCFPNFYLLNGQCVEQCGDTLYESKTTGNCEKCDLNCTSCSGTNQCSQCQASLNLFNGKCYSTCPAGTVPVNETQPDSRVILKCQIDPCIHYVTNSNQTTNSCVLCVPPYFIYQGDCINSCPNGTYLATLQCKTCKQGCLSCVSSSSCTQCASGYYFYNFNCISNCPTSTYALLITTPNGTFYQCSPCLHHCLICTNSTNCSKCSPGYYLSAGGLCMAQCPLGQFANAMTGKCQICTPNCQKCVSLTQCQSCANNTNLINGQCAIECPEGFYPSLSQCNKCAQACRSCVNSTACSQCKAGYLLNKATNECVLQCPSGTYKTTTNQCLVCPSTCATCVSGTECQSCNSSLILFNGRCISVCPSGYFKDLSNNCKQCDSFCKQCVGVRDNCTSCFQGYILSNGYCKNSCPAHYFMNSSNQCQSCNTSSQKCSECFGPSIDQCLQCYQPYFILNGICVTNCPGGYFGSTSLLRQCLPCDNKCLNCSVSSQNCITCPWGYYLVNGSCSAVCPNKYYPNPDTTNYTCLPCISPCVQCSSSQQCKTCLTGYYLSPLGTCVTSCPSLSTSQIGYFLNTNTSKCQKCSQNCLQCSSQSSCTKCNLPYHIYSSKCVADCPTNTFLDLADNICKACTQSYCTRCRSITQCTQCLSNQAYLLNGDCVTKCPDGYIAFNGKCVISNNNQTTCNKFWLNFTNGTSNCVQFCPNGYYANSGNCLPCSTACLSCTLATNCQLCIAPYKLLNNSCVIICPSGYLEMGSICVNCSSNCQTCASSTTQCTSCKTNFYLLNDKCFQVCPEGYFPNAATQKCESCLPRCLTCTDGAGCQTCVNSRYSPPTCTDNSCSSNQYKVQSTGQCANCDPICLTCSGGSSSNCVSCTSPLVLINGQCRSICPPGYTLHTANNSCVPCDNGCKSCVISTSTTSCIQCFDPMILNSDQCIFDCSLIETSTQFYTSDGSSCYPCSPYCVKCVLQDAATNSTSCQQCQYGYILYLGQCMSQCPAEYYSLQQTCYKCPQNCTQCSSIANSCRKCTNSTYLLNGQCVPQCPSSYFTNTNINNPSCLPCSIPNCLKCQTSANTCTECSSPFVKDSNGTCNQCISGYLYSFSTKFCVPCSSNCLTCVGQVTNCVTCDNIKVLLEGKCIDSCPQGYYKATNSVTFVLQCKKCPINCTVCQPSAASSSVLQCMKCIPGYYHNIATHQCLPQCPSNTYISNSVDCSLCPTKCLTCSSSDKCLSCNMPYYLFENNCINACPSGYTPINSTCLPCSTGCKVCVSPTNCTECRSDYIKLSNNTCSETPICPKGQYADANGLCQNCSDNCLQCSSLSNCTQCSSTKFLTNGQCAEQCAPNQYSISTTVNGTASKICIDCQSPCDACTNATACSHCIVGFFLTANKTCVTECGNGYYEFQNTNVTPTNRQCKPCADIHCKSCNINGCEECSQNYYLFGYIVYNRTNGTCVQDCPSGYFKDTSVAPLSCKQCSVTRCDKCNSTHCQKCVSPYILLNQGSSSSCVSQCPTNMITVTISNITQCQNCMVNCLLCRSGQWCTKCDVGYYLHVWANLSTVNITNYNATCVQDCPIGYFKYNDLMNTQNSTCNPCSTHCSNCTDENTCTQCISDLYIIYNNECIPYKCANCTTCDHVHQICRQCQAGFFLFSDGKCYSECPQRYYGVNETKKCQPCMQFCVKCPNITMCDTCQTGYNFTGTVCVDEAFMQFGTLSNMSGFTSNITEVTTAVYLGTSIGPLVFGQMTSTYFNIQFCQFILFHGSASGQNSEMDHFLNSLQSISLTVAPPNNTAQGRRRLLNSLTDPATFLFTSAPIFGLMGGFLLAYILIIVLQRNIDGCCLSCPRFKFYVTQICVYMKQRFKWIYFDFVAWISFLPFLYFSIMQLKSFSFNTGLEGFSCILSILIVIVYPLYPFFILYLLKTNYNDLVQQNNRMVEMSMSPYVFKVKRPTKQIVQGQPIKDYLTAQNLRLVYDPLKYLRKFIFVLVVALCPMPVTTLIVLIILNIIFMGYMAVFRPRLMPYMVFDFIIEGILLFFEIFMLVYLAGDGAKISAMSIATHAVGFITANLSLVIAIILNLIAYYKIFMCIYELYQHLKQKMQEKEKAKLKDQQFEHQKEHDDPDQIIHDDLPEKQNLTKSLRGNNIRKRGDDEITDQDNSEIDRQLMKDKQLFGDDGSGIQDSMKKSKGGLPDLKKTQHLKKKQPKKQQNQIDQNTLNNFFDDKQLPKRERKVEDDDDLTDSNPNSKIMSGILKDKQIYKKQSDQLNPDQLKNEIPKLKKNDSEIRDKNKLNPSQKQKLKKVTESDEDSMMKSHVSSNEELIRIKDGETKQVKRQKFKRKDDADPNNLIVAEGIPVKVNADKFKRKNEQQQKQKNKNDQSLNLLEPSFIEDDKKKKNNIDQVIQEGKFKNRTNPNKQKGGEDFDLFIDQGDMKMRENQKKKTTFKPTNSDDDEPFGAQDMIIRIQQSKKKQLKEKPIDMTETQWIKIKEQERKKTNLKQNKDNKYDNLTPSQIVRIKEQQRKKLDKQNKSDDDEDDFADANLVWIKQSQKKQANKTKKEDNKGQLAQIQTKQREKNRKSKKQNQDDDDDDDDIVGANMVWIKQSKADDKKIKKSFSEDIAQGDTVNFKQRKKQQINKEKKGNEDDHLDGFIQGKVVQVSQQKKKKFKKRGGQDPTDFVQENVIAIKQKNKKAKQNKNEQDDIDYGQHVQGNVIRIQEEQDKKKKRTNNDDRFEEEYVKGRVVKIQEQQKRERKKGHLGINEQQDQNYSQIKRKNKNNLFSPDKGKAGAMMNSLNLDQFENSDYENRPDSKIERPSSKGKGVLGIDEKSDNEQDSASVRQRRNSAIQKLRKKQGNLNIDQRSDYSDDSASSRPEKKQKRQRRKRQKSGILKMNNKNEGEEDGMQKIQL